MWFKNYSFSDHGFKVAYCLLFIVGQY